MKRDLIIRSKSNPILKANEKNYWENLCVLNPAVIFDEENDEFVMVYRAAGDDVKHVIQLGLAKSKDGINFTRQYDFPVFACDEFDADGGCVEDPRLMKVGDTFYLTYAARAFAPGRYWLQYDEYMAQGYCVEEQSETAPKFVKTNHTVTYLASTKDFVKYGIYSRVFT